MWEGRLFAVTVSVPVCCLIDLGVAVLFDG